MADRIITYGIIGLGNLGYNGHIKNLREIDNARIVAICDTDEKKTRDIRDEFILKPRGYNDYKELLNDDEVDIVLIATPNATHTRILSDTISKNKACFMEKPLAMTEKDLDLLNIQCKKYDAFVQIGHELRFAYYISGAKEYLESGALGDIVMISNDEFRKPWLTDWRFYKEHTGGLFLEKNCHQFDLFSWFLGEKPVAVSAFGGINVLKNGNNLDNGIVNIEYENNRRASLRVSLFSSGIEKNVLNVVCTGGRMEIDLIEKKCTIYKKDCNQSEQLKLSKPIIEEYFHDGIRMQHESMIDRFINGEKPLVDYNDGVISSKISILAERSVETGKTIYF